MGRVWRGRSQSASDGNCAPPWEDASGACVPQGPLGALVTAPGVWLEPGPTRWRWGFRSLLRVLGQIA